MANRVYKWGAIGLQSGQIDIHKGRICAALVKGAKWREYDKFVSDLQKRGAVLLSVSGSVDLSPDAHTEANAETMASLLSPVPEGETVDCMVFYQAAKRLEDADLPPSQQRLVAFFDTHMEDGDVPEMPSGYEGFLSRWAADREAEKAA